MKILVADDEMVSRGKLQTIMSRFGRCKAVAGGTKAMEAFEQAWKARDAYDVIMLDISMPDLAGPEVLARIRSFERIRKVPKSDRAAVIMVTSHADRDHIVSCMERGCNDYIVKPFSLKTIQAKMNRLKLPEQGFKAGEKGQDPSIEVEKLVHDALERFEAGEITLPSSPRLTMAFRQMILDGAEFKDLADLLSQDAAVAAELIRVSNSALYRGLDENRTIEQAVARLGTGVTEQVVAAICHRSLFVQKKKSYAPLLDRLWRHSLATGHACDLIAGRAAPQIQTEAFTIGLLHDVGWLLLIQILSEMETKKADLSRISQTTLIDMLDTHHGEFGARIFKQWGFPEKYQDICRYHHHPELAGKSSAELATVYLANLMAIDAGYDLKENADTLPLQERDAGQGLNLSADTLNLLSEQLKERMGALDGLLT